MRITPRFLVATAIAVLGLIAGALFWNQAFPTAALQFSLTESGAETKSRELLKSIDYDLKGYLAATQFGEDSQEKNYIEKEYGVRALEKKAREGVNIWYWTTRFFKPEQEEEIAVAYDPQGRFVGLFHTIAEDAERPFLTRDQARTVAESFLKKYVTHHPFDKLKLVEDSSKQRKKRTDYFFTWEEDSLRMGDATYQIHITVKGDKVGSFNENVKVPESWQRQFSTQRSTNALFQSFAEFASYPIKFALFGLFIFFVIKHKLRWRTAVPYRWLILFGLVQLAVVWNNVPDVLSSYRTTQKWGSYLFTEVGSSVLAVLGSVLSAYLLSLVADAIYRDQLPEKLPFSKALGRNSLYQPETVRNLGIGIVLACFGIGYVCTFYVIANKLGAWSPVEIDYSKILGGPIPWISGIEVGLSAAWTEEFMFRAVGILFYWKVLRLRNSWKWIGIVLACVTWAFLHSNYPQMPGYLRGCELSVEGILWGAIMVRYGIVATLTGHYLYDCWLSSIFVFQSADPLNKFGAVLVSIWPILLWLIGQHYLRTGQQPPSHPEDLDETAHAPATPEPEPVHEWNFSTHAFKSRQRVLLLLTALLTLIVVEYGDYPYNAMDGFGDITLSRSEIATAADQTMRDHGQDPSTYRKLISLSSNSTNDDYLLDYGTEDDIADLFDNEWPDLVWHIRYFRFRQKEEFNLTLDRDGYLVRWSHSIPREAKGESLDRGVALKIAQRYLTEEYGVDFGNEKLAEDNVRQEVNRRDYTFTWERKDWDWGDSQLRTSIVIQGDEPVNFNRYVKVPDEWDREQEKKYGGWKDAILDQISVWSSFAMAILLFIAFVLLLRRGSIPWKAGFLIALVPTALLFVEKLNALPWFYGGYSTTKPVLHYVLQRLGSDLASLISSWVTHGLKLSVTFAIVAWAFGWTLDRLHWPKFNWPTLRRSMLDYFALLFISLALLWVTDYFQTWLTAVTTDKPSLSVDYPSVNYAVPWLAALIDSLQYGYNTLLRYALLAGIAVLIHRRAPWLVWTLLLVYPLYDSLHADTMHDFIREVATSEFTWILAIFLVWKLWRFDAAMIFVVSALVHLTPEVMTFLDKGGPAYEWQAAPLMIATLVLIVLGWWLRPAPIEPVDLTLASLPKPEPYAPAI